VRQGHLITVLAVAFVLLFPGNAGAFGPLSSFGAFGEGAGELDRPSGIAVDDGGRFYVADTENNRVVVFGAGGDFLFAFGKDVRPGGGDVCTATTGCLAATDEEVPGSVAGAIRRPAGVAFGPTGLLYVGDAFNSRISVFAPDGAFLYAFGKGVNAGSGNPNACTSECQRGESDGAAGSLGEPMGVDFSASGRLFVADHGQHRVAVFNSAGAFIRAFGKNVTGTGEAGVCTVVCFEGEVGSDAGEMRLPTDVAAGPAGEVAVADADNRRVDVFTAEGTFLHAFGKEVNPGGGDVCTVVSGCQQGLEGDDYKTLAFPRAIEFDRAGDLYISDSENARVAQFELGGVFLRAFGEGVIDGASSFQVCTQLTGCQAGGLSGGPGSIQFPYGIALDCRGAVHVVEEDFDFSRVERFGEAGTPPCAELSTDDDDEFFARPPSNRFRFGRLVLNRGNGRAVLFVRVPGPGRVILHGRGFRRLARSASRATVVRLPVKPKVRLRIFLRRHGKARIRLNVTFKPIGGTPHTREKVVVLRKRR
jgi:sugar lactone lactonase YvrE